MKIVILESVLAVMSYGFGMMIIIMMVTNGS